MKGLKTGGRTKGTPNKRSLQVEEMAAQYKLDPFDFLMKVVNNDWEGIGVEPDKITTDHRIQAAKFASKYLYSEKKPLELDVNKQSITIEIKDYTAVQPQVIEVKKE
jgi:hypothetical protein